MRCILPIGSHWSFGASFGVWPALEVWPEVCIEAETVQWALESCSWGGGRQLGWSWAVHCSRNPIGSKTGGSIRTPFHKAPTEREYGASSRTELLRNEKLPMWFGVWRFIPKCFPESTLHDTSTHMSLANGLASFQPFLIGKRTLADYWHLLTVLRNNC